ncbi:DUF72 domain-containing protein [Pseudomonas sp. EpS/L25]|uniref:DUF72 domain-containing protein n=1 Tax=Pseudomonas sp. EpS/L25 TaxID=1749078 RepID=UPI000743E132|nr:DUF72 domain-containing protein [Pseudomonas sp. EpS/L25]KUM44896.1 hypothetical protein AR540_00385 [Pseudomonas sp. EpS/L25]
MLPYFLGCPSWNDNAWRESLYHGLRPADFLPRYTQVFNAVEGNTTLYAWPSADKIRHWAEVMPAGFRFCAKFPQDISHADDLRVQLSSARTFIDLLEPLGERASPLWLQLPRRFGPERLNELKVFLDALAPRRTLAVEVRHLAFFDKGDAERALNRLLLDLGVERIGLDSAALFSADPSDPAVRLAQSKKPRVPARALAFSAQPQVRFIGRLELAANDYYLAKWVSRVADWIEAGKQPFVFLHTPDNRQAPELALRFHAQLRERLPGLPELPTLRTADTEQLGLL